MTKHNSKRQPFLGHSESIRQIRADLEKMSQVHTPVLIQGESGVGKELIARELHALDHVGDKPFLGINCAAIPESLLESELFGYQKGAFTGADSHKEGLLVKAGDGTVFLDEIGDMPLAMQVKILRVLEEGEVMPLGASQSVPMQARVICATNRNLETEVKAGRFRADLYYRIHVLKMDVPPLRERLQDLPELTESFLKQIAAENEIPLPQLSPEVLDVFESYSWPGNVRELRNALVNLCLHAKNGFIDLETVREHSHLLEKNDMTPQDALAQLTRDLEGGVINLSDAKKEFERLQLLRALKEHGGNITNASESLGMPRPQVSRLVKKYGLKDLL